MMLRNNAFLALVLSLGFLVPSTIADEAPEARLRGPAPYAVVQDHHPPDRLRIPSLALAADIRPVGMVDDITMEIPDDIKEVGWFRYSALAGRPTGTMVLVGHRDGRSDPDGVFRELATLEVGSLLHVRAAGRAHRYVVVDVATVRKIDFAALAPSIFEDDGPPRLVLLTCGGTYDRSRGGYQANVIVTATLR